MKDQLVAFKTTKLAKEKGFNWKCRGRIHVSHFHFVKNNIIPDNVPTNDNEMFAPIEDHNNKPSVEFARINPQIKEPVYDRLSLPTQSLLQKWLREKHKIHASVYGLGGSWKCAIYDITSKGNYEKDQASSDMYDTYENALESGLINALKLI
jgi:hypothetical protein